MPHPVLKRYRLLVLVLMVAIYLPLMWLVFPHARDPGSGMVLRASLALLSVSPVIALIWLMALRVMHSDELEQRVELMALSTATGIVTAASLIGGFLVSVQVLQFGGDILIWVFPSLSLCYSAARWLFGRRYGGVGCG
jgi:hypothetical protein